MGSSHSSSSKLPIEEWTPQDIAEVVEECGGSTMYKSYGQRIRDDGVCGLILTNIEEVEETMDDIDIQSKLHRRILTKKWIAYAARGTTSPTFNPQEREEEQQQQNHKQPASSSSSSSRKRKVNEITTNNNPRESISVSPVAVPVAEEDNINNTAAAAASRQVVQPPSPPLQHYHRQQQQEHQQLFLPILPKPKPKPSLPMTLQTIRSKPPRKLPRGYSERRYCIKCGSRKKHHLPHESFGTRCKRTQCAICNRPQQLHIQAGSPMGYWCTFQIKKKK